MIQNPQLSGSLEIIERKLNLKELELTSLMEITQAINANLPEESLYKIFHFTLIANLRIGKLALFVCDDTWDCKVYFGTSCDIRLSRINDDILEIKKISPILNKKGFEEFKVVIPIVHKAKVLAYVFLGDKVNAENNDSIDFPFIQTLTSILIVAIENKKLARKELQQEAIKKELAIARDVQSLFIPKELPFNEQICVQATYLPHQSIGGDYYDYIEIDKDRFLICIADVSGKGIPAALLMSNFQASLRALIRQTTDLEYIVKELNLLIMRSSKGDRFITFFAAIYDHTTKKLEYINAGHNPPVLIDKDKVVSVLDKGSTILGAFKDLPFVEKSILDISPSSFLMAYTDGVTEVENENNEEYGFEGFQAFLLQNHLLKSSELHDRILKELNTFSGNKSYPDDISFISCFFY
jgi:phosphoserine phosphatase RsbU/P